MRPEELNEYIDVISERLGAAQPMAELIIQQYAQTHMIYFFGSLGLILAFILTWLVVLVIDIAKSAPEEKGFPSFIAGIFIAVAILFSASSAVDNYIKATNPQYHIMKDAMK